MYHLCSYYAGARMAKSLNTGKIIAYTSKCGSVSPDSKLNYNTI